MNHAMRMAEIGDQLEHAVAADLRAGVRSQQPRPVGWRARLATRRARIFGGLAVAVAIAAPGAAWATGAFTSPRQEASSLPATSTIFTGTDPTCTVVRQNVEYRCTLAHAPRALPYLALSNARQMQLFGMSPAQSAEFLRVATGQNRAAYQAFVAGVRRYRAALDQRLLTAWHVPAAVVAQWVSAMEDLRTATDVRAGHFTGYVMQTDDAEYRSNGACRATNADGTRWHCYLGEAAVRAGLVGPDVLGGQGVAGPTDDL